MTERIYNVVFDGDQRLVLQIAELAQVLLGFQVVLVFGEELNAVVQPGQAWHEIFVDQRRTRCVEFLWSPIKKSLLGGLIKL